MENTTVSFKIFFQNNDNIRRFRMEKRPTYEEFVAFMEKLYAPVYHPELRLQYVDSEGDNIDVTSQLEWEEMFKELSNEKIIKIQVVEGNGNYFKDGPEPVPLFLYDDPVQKKPIQNEDENLSVLRSRVPQCLQELFAGKKVLPHNLPSFLEGIVTVINLPNNVVDIDVDVPKLQNALFRKGYDFLENHEYEKGRSMYRALLLLIPEDPTSTYNLACAESLLGNKEEAVKVLKRAVQVGYKNLSHMLVDGDLKNIMDMPEFKEIVREMEEGQQLNSEKLPVPTEKETETLPQLIPQPVLELPPYQQPILTPQPVLELPPIEQPRLTPQPVLELPPIQQPILTPQPVLELPPFQPTPINHSFNNPNDPFREFIPPYVLPVQVTPKETEPVKVNEPIYVPHIPFPVMPVSYSNPLYKKWEAELGILHEVGYVDDDLLITYLEKSKGSVEQTVLALLDM
jgi:tetratricopeptide (TPR) repeat protein